MDDPKFAASGLDTGYLTTEPGTRETLFYDPATANPAVVALDEADKDTVTTGELDGMITMLAEPPAQQPSNQITVPVLVVAGRRTTSSAPGSPNTTVRAPHRSAPTSPSSTTRRHAWTS